MPASAIERELAVLRSLAARGDQQADLIVRTFDAMRATQKAIAKVLVATTANRTLSGLTNTNLDGVTPAAGDLILVKNQTDAKENGIYVAASGAWTRLVDDNGDYVMAPGLIVQIVKGSTLADTTWVVTSDATVVGTDNIVFAQQVTSVGAGSVTSTELADGAVTVAKLAAATGAKIFGAPTLAVGVEGAGAANAIDVTITLKDILGTALAAKAMATIWISDTAGAAPSGSAPNGGTTVQTGTLLKAVTAGVLLDIVSDASGVIVVRLTDSGTPTFFVNVAVGDVIASSAAVTFA